MTLNSHSFFEVYRMGIKVEDKYIINLMNLSDSEYYDEIILFDNRKETFWNLSCVRNMSLPDNLFHTNRKVLLLNDTYGALVGAACNIFCKVTVVIENQDYAAVLKNRYVDRNNIDLITITELENDLSHPKFDNIILNLDNLYEYDWQDSFKVDEQLNIAEKFLTTDGKLIISAPGSKAYDLERIIYNNGFNNMNSFDPIGNGSLIIEVAKLPFKGYEVYPSQQKINFREYVKNPWIMHNGIALFCDDIKDQDYDLIEDVKKVELDLLRELIKFCENHSLQVYPIYGTLLGLMRDGGVIPGDDDIDVALPRKDFDKLVSLSDEFSGDYYLQTPYSDNCFCHRPLCQCLEHFQSVYISPDYQHFSETVQASLQSILLS